MTPAPNASSTPQAGPATLETRAQAYWARRQAKDLAGAYEFYCPEYRARVSREQFLQLTRLNRFNLTDVRVANVAAAGARSEVTITYRFFLPTLSDQPLEGRASDWWARDGTGVWCKEDEPLVLPFPGSARRSRP